MDGFLVVDKPAGCTSHDVVHRVRRLLGGIRTGHTGTLDPFATGVLPIALGDATRAIQFLDEGEKVYRAVLRLGQATDTQDLTGSVIAEGDWQSVDHDRLTQVVASFLGPQQQLPPMFSAVKRDGVPLYRLARRGEEVAREPRSIVVHELAIVAVAFPQVTLQVRCSRGTYVRTLAHDLGERLGCHAHLLELRRLASGPFTIASAVTLEQLADEIATGSLADHLLRVPRLLGHLPAYHLSADGERWVRNGRLPLPAEAWGGVPPCLQPGARCRLVRDNLLVAVAEMAADGTTLRLLRVFPALSPLQGA